MNKQILTLSGKVAIVTGGTNGIGKAIAIKMAESNIKVVIVGRNQERAEEVVENITKIGGEAFYLLGDLNDEFFLDEVVRQSINKYEKIDILVNCAGILTASTIQDITSSEWDSVMNTNLKSSFFMMQKCIPYLMKSRNGRIINISSNAGRMGGYENSQAYTASKGGMISITMGIARQLAKDGITVNVICPGTTRTDMADLYDEDKKRHLIERIPIGRFVEPNEIATAVLYFASEEAACVTGAILDINGGMYMG